MQMSFDWIFWFIICSIPLAPFYWYANQVGHEAVEEKRESSFLGQVPIWVKYAEVERLAKEGDRFAKWTLAAMRLHFVLTMLVVFVSFMMAAQNGH